MPARLCKECGIAYPVGENFVFCKVCEGPNVYKVDREPDLDWEARTEDASADTSEETRVFAWRVERLRGLGVDFDLAKILAAEREGGSYVVDIGRFEYLLKNGWTIEQAAAVLG